MRGRVTLIGVVVAACGVVAASLAAQGTREPDVLASLLTEVRGLRQAMEQMAAAGPRVQLALGRLQLQEQRVNAMIRRLEGVRDNLTGAERGHADLQRQIVWMQEEVKSLNSQRSKGQHPKERTSNQPTPNFQPPKGSDVLMPTHGTSVRSSRAEEVVCD